MVKVTSISSETYRLRYEVTVVDSLEKEFLSVASVIFVSLLILASSTGFPFLRRSAARKVTLVATVILDGKGTPDEKVRV